MLMSMFRSCFRKGLTLLWNLRGISGEESLTFTSSLKESGATTAKQAAAATSNSP